MRFKSFKLGALKGKSEEDAADTEEEQIQEQASKETDGIDAATESMEGVSGMSNKDNNEEPTPGPHGPVSELTVEPQDTLLDEEADVSGLFDESEEEDVTIVEVTAKAAASEEKEKTEEPPKEDSDDSFSNLFSTEEEDANPLENLLNSLPDVTVRELLDDLQEIRDLLQDGQQK
jgi:hypothetical protein